jgi:CheY-like chemotaxis protein
LRSRAAQEFQLRAETDYNEKPFSSQCRLVPALRAPDCLERDFDRSMKTSESSNTRRILIADDQRDVLEALRLLLKGEGYKTEAVTSPAEVLPRLETGDFDLLLMDLNYARDTTSGQEGLDLLSRIQGADITLPVVVMTAWGSVEVAVEAMRRGARDLSRSPGRTRACSPSYARR